MALIKSDFNQIRIILKEELENQEQKFEEKITEVKSDFIEKIDPILKEIVTSREERPLIENRIEKLEKLHPEGKSTNIA